jgi:hypothetical protein
MEIEQPPNITSFVIRFVHAGPALETSLASKYRGTIRHVQTDQEVTFTHWHEAVEFINRFILIVEDDG